MLDNCTMIRKIRSFLGLIRKNALKTLTGLIPKDKNLILFSAWFGERYADSSMYQFEYMLKHTNYRLFWYTKNKELFHFLKNRGIPVLYSNDFKSKWYQSRAIMLVSSVQVHDYNPFFLNKCIFFDLDHGFPGKPTGLAQPTVTKEWRDGYLYLRKGLDFYQTAANRHAADVQCENYASDYNHQIFANKPRIDVLFDEKLQKGKNESIEKIKKNHRIISYLPTHRSCGRVPIKLNEVLNLGEIQKICEENNTFFVIKKHFYHRNEIENLGAYKNIIDVTQEEIDTQVLLAQSDVLVTDFSSCFNDYLALDRPIVFYAYDYDNYMTNERDYYWKYDMITAGYTAKTNDEFVAAIKALSSDWSDSKHEKGRKEMRRFYFDDDVEMGKTREKVCGIMGQLINGTYKPFDWTTRL